MSSNEFNHRDGTVSPCKACIDRKPGCHDSCEGYISWKNFMHERDSYLYHMRINTFTRVKYSRRNIIQNGDSKVKKKYGAYKK